MQNFTKNYYHPLILRKGVLLVFFLIFSSSLYALTIEIHGPSEVCPDGTYTFTSTARNRFGNVVTASCSYDWRVIKSDGTIIGPFGGWGGRGSSDGPTFTYKFERDTGPVTVRLIAKNGLACSSDEDNKQVNVALKAPAPISGPSSMCAGESKSFEVTNPSSDPNTDYGLCNFHHWFQWSVPSGWTVTSGNPSRSNVATIKAPASAAAGTYQIRVRGWYDDRGDYSPYRTFNVTVGPPNASGMTIDGPSEVCPGDFVSFSAYGGSGITSYNWTWPSGWTYYRGQGTQFISLGAPNGGFSFAYIQLEVTNDCGSAMLYKSVNQSYYCNYTYSVSPNPASDSFEVHVEKEDPNETNESEEVGDLEFILYNDNQVKLKYLKTDKKKSKIEVKDLPNGTYALHILHKGERIIKQVIINRK